MNATRSAEVVHEQFDDVAQQRDSANLGMWVFLATEVMFFGGLFLAFLVYRMLYPEAFVVAQQRLDIVAGSGNTVILLTSSFAVSIAVAALRGGSRWLTICLLAVACLLGTAFLLIKGFEYKHDWETHVVPGASFRFDYADPGHAQLFFVLYFLMTGLHGVHMLIGLGVLASMAFLVAAGRVAPARYLPLQVAGLYWHFVDVVWVFLFPLLYLSGGR